MGVAVLVIDRAVVPIVVTSIVIQLRLAAAMSPLQIYASMVDFALDFGRIKSLSSHAHFLGHWGAVAMKCPPNESTDSTPSLNYLGAEKLTIISMQLCHAPKVDGSVFRPFIMVVKDDSVIYSSMTALAAARSYDPASNQMNLAVTIPARGDILFRIYHMPASGASIKLCDITLHTAFAAHKLSGPGSTTAISFSKDNIDEFGAQFAISPLFRFIVRFALPEEQGAISSTQAVHAAIDAAESPAKRHTAKGEQQESMASPAPSSDIDTSRDEEMARMLQAQFEFEIQEAEARRNRRPTREPIPVPDAQTQLDMDMEFARQLQQQLALEDITEAIGQPRPEPTAVDLPRTLSSLRRDPGSRRHTADRDTGELGPFTLASLLDTQDVDAAGRRRRRHRSDRPSSRVARQEEHDQIRREQIRLLHMLLSGQRPQYLAQEEVDDDDDVAAPSLTVLPTSLVPEGSPLLKIECLVCYENFIVGAVFKTLPCLHMYHANCIDEWLQRKPTCPICNNSVHG